MQKGREFEKQIEKVIDYIEKLGFHGHKNYAKRTVDGNYLEGEAFDYEIFLPNRHDCFDAKQCTTDTWHIMKKDIKQVNELKKCKNAGCNAYFLICFENKDVRMIDVDYVIEVLKQNKKNIKSSGFPSWDLINEIKGGNMQNCKNCGKYPFCPNINEKGCEEWVKRSYETKLVKVDGLNYKFEEVK